MATKKKATTESTAEVLTAAVEGETAVEAETEAAAVESKTAEDSNEPQLVKAVVRRTFRDKNSGKIYHIGDVIEVTEERLAEINSKKFHARQI